MANKAKTAPSPDNLLIGKGKFFFDRFVDGASTGLRHLGNVEAGSIATADDTVEKRSSMEASAPVYKKVNRRRTVTLKVQGDEFNAENLALVQMGDVSQLIREAEEVADEAVAPAWVPGMYFTLANGGPYDVLPDITVNAVAAVLDTDYELIDEMAGLYRVLDDSALATGAVVATYTPRAYTEDNGPKVVSGGTSNVIEGRVLFIGDPSAGPVMKLDVWKVTVEPDGETNLISDDFASWQLSMTVLDDAANHPASPFYQTTYLGDPADYPEPEPPEEPEEP